MGIESDGAESPCKPRQFRKWVFALAALLLLAGLALVVTYFAGEKLVLYTSPPIAPSGKRIQLLAPAGWRATVDDDFGVVALQKKEQPYPWLRDACLREWLKLDAEKDDGLALFPGSLLQGMISMDPIKPGPPQKIGNRWVVFWKPPGNHGLVVGYGRANKYTFDKTYRQIMQSARIID